MPAPNQTDHDTELTPDDVRATFQDFTEYQHEVGSERSPLVDLLSPAARVQILDAMLHFDRPATASEICERAQIDTSTFSDHKDALLTAGVLDTDGKRGNATVYRLAREHPFVQCVIMAETAFRHGTTPVLLDEQFQADPCE